MNMRSKMGRPRMPASQKTVNLTVTLPPLLAEMASQFGGGKRNTNKRAVVRGIPRSLGTAAAEWMGSEGWGSREARKVLAASGVKLSRRDLAVALSVGNATWQSQRLTPTPKLERKFYSLLWS
jgi:hypothetical protein